MYCLLLSLRGGTAINREFALLGQEDSYVTEIKLLSYLFKLLPPSFPHPLESLYNTEVDVSSENTTLRWVKMCLLWMGFSDF
jgi:hypothetical protein